MLNFRKAKIDDIELYFFWTNEINVREQSFNSKLIDFDEHKTWFESKINDKNCMMLIFTNLEGQDVGQVRIQKESGTESLISISITAEQRGKGYSTQMLNISSDYFLKINSNFIINAFIKETNLASKYAFEKAGFEFIAMKSHQNHRSFHFKKFLCK